MILDKSFLMKSPRIELDKKESQTHLAEVSEPVILRNEKVNSWQLEELTQKSTYLGSILTLEGRKRQVRSKR